MALLLPKSVFIHVPKTGGTTLRECFLRSKIPHKEMGRPHDTYYKVKELYGKPLTDRFVFAFVRHPLTWYQSWWAYRMETGWDPDHPIDAHSMDYNFQRFVYKCLGWKPGLVQKMYNVYTGRPEEPIDFIGKQEQLIDHAVIALKMAGEEFDEQTFRSVIRFNPAASQGVWKSQCYYSRSLAEEVCAAENDAIERYGYAADSIEPFLSPEAELLQSSPQSPSNEFPSIITGKEKDRSVHWSVSTVS